MKKNKKGFTLVELLAVIVVLAIIMVIATMSVNGIIKKNRTEAFNKSMDVAVITAKRMLSSNEELTTESFKENIDYSNIDYEYYITSYEHGNLIIIKSINTGKFKNIDYNTIEKNSDYKYIENEDGDHLIIAKIDNNGIVNKADNIDKDTVNYVTGNYPETCTYSYKKSTYEIGDVISFCNYETGKSEDFYVINDDGNKVTALAKYPIAEDDNNDMHQFDNNFNQWFANRNSRKYIRKGPYNYYLGYWAEGEDKLYNKYGSSYPANVYNSSSILYSFVEKYKTYIKNTFNYDSSMRLITYSEIEELGCLKKETCDKKWIYHSRYWTGTAADYQHIYVVDSLKNSLWKQEFYDYSNSWANIRPVIEINKSEI